MELALLQEEITSMEKRLGEIEEKVASVDEKTTQIVSAILGNPLTKQGGFLADIEVLREQIHIISLEIERLKAKISKQDQFKNRVIWTIGSLISLGLLVKFIVDIYFTIKGK